jgi:hypothetical protein
MLACATIDREHSITTLETDMTIFSFALIMAIILGVWDAIKKMVDVSSNPSLGVGSSKNLVSFLFWDY